MKTQKENEIIKWCKFLFSLVSDVMIWLLGATMLIVLATGGIAHLKGEPIEDLQIDLSPFLKGDFWVWLWICASIILFIGVFWTIIAWVSAKLRMFSAVKRNLKDADEATKKIFAFNTPARERDKLSEFEDKVLTIIRQSQKTSAEEILSKVKTDYPTAKPSKPSFWDIIRVSLALEELRKLECVRIDEIDEKAKGKTRA